MPAPISPKTQADLRKRRQKAASAPSVLSIAPRPKVKPAPTTPTAPAPAPHKAAPARPAPAPAPTDPASITAALTPQQLDKEAAAAVRARFGGTEKELQGQQRVSDQMQSNIGGWFDQYKADVESARQRTADYNSGAQAAMNQQAQRAQAQDTALAVTPEAQQAAAARRTTQDSFGAMLARQAGAENAYQADKGRIGSGEETQQHINEAGRKATLGQQLADLQGQKGDYETGFRADARAAERKSALEVKAFGLSQATAKSDADLKSAAAKSLTADRKADNKRADAQAVRDKMEKDRQYQLDKAKLGVAQAKDNYQKEHGLGPYKSPAAPKGKGGKSNADLRKEQARKDKVRNTSLDALNRLDKAKGAWTTLGARVTTGAKDATGHDKVDSNGQPETRPTTDADRYAELVRQGYSPNEIHLMRVLLEGKKWGKQEVAMAHKLKIKVPREYLEGDQRPGVTRPLDPVGSGNNPVSRTGA